MISRLAFISKSEEGVIVRLCVVGFEGRVEHASTGMHTQERNNDQSGC